MEEALLLPVSISVGRLNTLDLILQCKCGREILRAYLTSLGDLGGNALSGGAEGCVLE